jgi:hypothetical protein
VIHIPSISVTHEAGDFYEEINFNVTEVGQQTAPIEMVTDKLRSYSAANKR